MDYYTPLLCSLAFSFYVGEAFTGTPGKFVPREETVRSFGEILAGKYDDLPEQAFYRIGNIDEVAEKAPTSRRGVDMQQFAAAK